MGTLAHAERLAEVLLPGMTARMWRARFLTFAAVSARVADNAITAMGGREDMRLAARLAFERLYVASVVRMHAGDPEVWQKARARLPGSRLARDALSTREPLTRSNFLKGQAVNGPYGVIATLAMHMGIVDAEGQLGRHGTDVILAWSADEGLEGVLDDEGARGRPGQAWLSDVTRAVVGCASKGEWPSSSSRVWEQLATHLRSDEIGREERRTLSRLFDQDDVRRRVLEILRDKVDLFRGSDERGKVERRMMVKGIKAELANDPTDITIRGSVTAIDAYEHTAGLLQQSFLAILWGLKQRDGCAAPSAILSQPRVSQILESTISRLPRAVAALESALMVLEVHPVLGQSAFTEPVLRLKEDAVAAGASKEALVSTVMSRHRRVQHEKRKGTWVDQEARWTLIPGFGIEGDSPPRYDDIYLHPFRIANAYQLMAGLGRVSRTVLDAEE